MGGGKKFALVSWKTIKMLWSEGGLQIRDLRIQNLAMGAKLLWNLLEPKPSWSSRVLNCKYFPGPRLRCLDEIREIKNGSPIYNLCKKVMPYFQAELHWIPGNGKLIRLWHDVILGQRPPHLPRLQSWMTALGLNSLWDISEWENVESSRCSGWKLLNCSADLIAKKNAAELPGRPSTVG